MSKKSGGEGSTGAGGPCRYRDSVLRELERFGLRPRPTTPPARLRELLNDLYTLEIRELKLRHRELEAFFGPQPLADYSEKVRALKTRYALLSLPLEVWTEPGEPAH